MELMFQVISLDLAKKLNELGVKQESIFCWERCLMKEGFVITSSYWHDNWSDECGDGHLLEKQEIYSAFTVSEIMDLLPQYINTCKNEPFDGFRFDLTRSVIMNNEGDKIIPTFIINYHCDTYKCDKLEFFPKLLFKNIWDESLAGALAKTLIYLIENKLMGTPS